MAKKSVSVPTTNLYKITLQANGDTFTQSHSDLTDAIMKLNPGQIKTRAIFTLEHDGKKSELMKNGTLAKLLLVNKPRAYYLAKNLITLLK